MTDKFAGSATGLTAPPQSMADVTPDDNNDLPVFTRALNVAAAGDIRITTIDGDTATVFVAAGVAFPIRARRVHATGTTASRIVALW